MIFDHFIVYSETTSTSNGSAKPSKPIPPPPPPTAIATASAKRTRDDSIDVIVPPSKKLRASVAEVEQNNETETDDQTSKQPRKAHDDIDSDDDSSFEKTESSTLPSVHTEFDHRISVCLKCGSYMKGSHANVGYCFSEHMCDCSLTPHQDEYLEAICIIANAMYANSASFHPNSVRPTSTPNSSMVSSQFNTSAPNESAMDSAISSNEPFNASIVGHALRGLLSEQH